jgi:TorA maturation chaperone TorD
MHADVLKILARADLSFLLSLLLESPSPAWQVSLREAQQYLPDLLASAKVSRDAAQIWQGGFETLLSILQVEGISACAAEHSRLFEGVVACPVNETAYIRRDKGAIIADVCAFYRAFGLERAEHFGEKADHLRCELDFVSTLLMMLARAKADNLLEQSAITLDALSAFMGDHLGEWFYPFCDRLSACAQHPFYGFLGLTMRAIWGELWFGAGVSGATASDDPVPVPPIPDEGTPYECGMDQSISQTATKLC